MFNITIYNALLFGMLIYIIQSIADLTIMLLIHMIYVEWCQDHTINWLQQHSCLQIWPCAWIFVHYFHEKFVQL